MQMMLDTGLTLAETLAEMQAERARLVPPAFAYCCSECSLAVLNTFGAFK